MQPAEIFIRDRLCGETDFLQLSWSLCYKIHFTLQDISYWVIFVLQSWWRICWTFFLSACLVKNSGHQLWLLVTSADGWVATRNDNTSVPSVKANGPTGYSNSWQKIMSQTQSWVSVVANEWSFSLFWYICISIWLTNSLERQLILHFVIVYC